ncbi:hypothetical protein J1G43_14640 [Cellulomonas sp. zg-ZUI22]|nr:hypothetical protein [Cellulomonas sp. zg-ZUI22]
MTRDTFEHAPPELYTLRRYVARQSLISAFAGPAPVTAPSSITSSFQRRMLEGDAAGNLPQLLTEAPLVDLLLWDLTDERLGVLVSPEDHVVTRSVERMRVGVDEVLDGWRHVELGSQEHHERWTAALGHFRKLLGRLGLLDRTLLLDVPWAVDSDDGSPVPSSFGMSSYEANERLAPYYEEAGAAGLGVGRVAPEQVIAAANHRWGHAPFHYTDITYAAVVNVIERSRPWTGDNEGTRDA